MDDEETFEEKIGEEEILEEVILEEVIIAKKLRSLEMRVAELEDKIKSITISDEDLEGYRKVAALSGFSSAMLCGSLCFHHGHHVPVLIPSNWLVYDPNAQPPSSSGQGSQGGPSKPAGTGKPGL